MTELTRKYESQLAALEKRLASMEQLLGERGEERKDENGVKERKNGLNKRNEDQKQKADAKEEVNKRERDEGEQTWGENMVVELPQVNHLLFFSRMSVVEVVREIVDKRNFDGR